MNHAESIVVGITGPRGGGKTLLLTYFGAKQLVDGSPVWSNYQVKFSHNRKRYKAEPLNIDALYTFSPEYRDGFILIDEMQYLADALRSSSNANKLMDSFIMQLRKRRLNFLYTAKFMEWVDRRIRYETDVEINCMDASFTPKGRERGMEKGTTFYLTFKDLSGLMTGVSFYQSGISYPQTFSGKAIHNKYDSNEIIDVIDAMRSIDNKLAKRVLSDPGIDPYEEFANRFPTFQSDIATMFSDRDSVPLSEVWGRTGISKRQDKILAKQILAPAGITDYSSGSRSSLRKER